jgi:flavin-dependent dehydrogenase
MGPRRRAVVTAQVVVVGGGPAGAVTAMLLARNGVEVVLLERAPAWRWRACGVFTSPATVQALRRIGLSEVELARVARLIPTMRVESLRGATFGLTYGGGGTLADSPVGLDRSALDPLLLSMARAAGADVREGVAVEAVSLPDPSATTPRDTRVSIGLAGGERLLADLVIGADGLRSIVAAAARARTRSPLGPRIGLTFHVPDGAAPGSPGGEEIATHAMDARMVVIDGGYVGLAPVPGGRLNVGIVLSPSWFPALRRAGAPPVARSILKRVLSLEDPSSVPILDHVAGALPLGVGARRRAGPGWLLVGDAAGFLDPFTGEGLHRAVVSAELAAEVIGSAPGRLASVTLEDYDRAMRARFGMKDVVSRLTQAFLGRPVLFEYAARRLAARERVRETMGRVMGDLVPASRALDPRYLAALLAP